MKFFPLISTPIAVIGNGETTSPTFSIVGANPEAEKWVPTLLEPNADAQWIKGSVYTVVWYVDGYVYWSLPVTEHHRG